MLPRRDLRDRIFLYTSAELTYVFAYYTSFMWPLRATFMPRRRRQYSRLDAARAVMSRWRNYVIGPRSALPILLVQQLLLPRLPGVMLSPGVSIWEHNLPLSTIALQMREVWENSWEYIVLRAEKGKRNLLAFISFTNTVTETLFIRNTRDIR